MSNPALFAQPLGVLEACWEAPAKDVFFNGKHEDRDEDGDDEDDEDDEDNEDDEDEDDEDDA